MSGPWGSEGSLDDAGYIQRFREFVDDWPQPADEQLSPDGSKTKLKCQRLKLNDDDYFTVVSGGTQIPVVNQLSKLNSGNCYADFNTGLVTFGQAPAAGQNTVQVLHNQVKWRDSAILSAMYDCLMDLYPTIWRNAVDTSITMAVLKWDYQLPSDFADPRVRIRRIGIREIPANTNRFYPLSGPYTIYGNPPQIRIPTSQSFSPGATLQIEYAAPYSNLVELEPQAAALPIWFAAGSLLGFQELNRARTDGQTVTADQNAVPPQYRQNAGAWYMARYREMKANLHRPMGMPRPVFTFAQ